MLNMSKKEKKKKKIHKPHLNKLKRRKKKKEKQERVDLLELRARQKNMWNRLIVDDSEHYAQQSFRDAFKTPNNVIHSDADKPVLESKGFDKDAWNKAR